MILQIWRLYDCLTRKLDFFDKIIYRKLIKLVNKAKTKNCEMSDNQKMLITQRMQYLRCAYHKCDVNHRFKFSDCYKRAIKQIEMVGVKLIDNYQILMRRDRVFRQEEYFHLLNPYVENNRTYQLVLFEFFPQLKIDNKMLKMCIFKYEQF